MPYTDNLQLEKVYTSPETGNTYSYATIDITTALPESNQIQVRWEVVTVEDTSGNPVQTNELSAFEREQIFIVDASYLTFNEAANSITVDSASISGATVTVTTDEGSTVDYVYPDFTLINAANPLKLRRSINLTDPVVDFANGSRLTADQLNAAFQQLLFAGQETSVFGAGAGGNESTVNLANESINNLGDVSINLTNSGALLSIGADGTITDSTTGGVTAVLEVNGETGFVTLDHTDVGAAAAVHTHTMADITDISSITLSDLADASVTSPTSSEALYYDGSNFVNHEPVTVASGTGAPPSEWLNAPGRKPTDLYIRTG